MGSVCKINSLSDIDYESLKKKVKDDLNEMKDNFDKLENLRKYAEDNKVNSYKVSNAINEELLSLSKKIKFMKVQNKCQHRAVFFHQNVGYDSHKDHYRTYCMDCDLTIEEYHI